MKGCTLDKVRDLRYKRIVEDVESDDSIEDERNSHANLLKCQTLPHEVHTGTNVLDTIVGSFVE